MAIRDIPIPDPPGQENFELALANRKLTTALLGMVLLAGLIACMSYLAGRTVTNLKANSAADAPVAAPPPTVVEPLAKPSPTAVNTVVAPAPAAVPTVVVPQAARQEPPPATADAVPRPGTVFLQVGYIDAAQSNHFAAALRAKGYSPSLVATEDGRAVRVLLGPIGAETEPAALQARLAADGYESFLKRF